MSIRFGKENLIEFLKRNFTPTSQYYSWRTIEYAPCKYYACGRHVVQEILRSIQAEDISIEEYVYEYYQFDAISDFYRPNWFRYLENRKERHIANCKLRKNTRSKDKRRKNRKESKAQIKQFS